MKKRMNLYSQYLQDEKKGRSVTGWLNGLVALLVIAILMGAFGLKLMLEKVSLEGDIRTIHQYVSNEANVDKVARVDAIIKENQELNKLKTSIGEISKILDAKSTLSTAVLNDIEFARPNGMVLEDMRIVGSNAVLTFYAKDQKAASQFVSGLKEGANIKEVLYNGYTYDKTKDHYQGSVALVLKGDF